MRLKFLRIIFTFTILSLFHTARDWVVIDMFMVVECLLTDILLKPNHDGGLARTWRQLYYEWIFKISLLYIAGLVILRYFMADIFTEEMHFRHMWNFTLANSITAALVM